MDFKKPIIMKPPMPTHLWMATTGRCNLRCRHCAFLLKGDSPSEKAGDLHPKVFERLERWIFPSLKTVMIGGNNFSEPLFAKNWDHIFQTISNYSIRPYIVTNGILLNEKNLSAIEKANGVIFISTEGATEETYRAFRCVDFKKVKEKIKMAVALRETIRSDFQIRFNFTMMSTNLHEVPLLIEMAAELGMDGVNCMHFVPFREEQRFLSLYYHQNETISLL